jgi:hypothetical protein
MWFGLVKVPFLVTFEKLENHLLTWEMKSDGNLFVKEIWDDFEKKAFENILWSGS